MLKQIKNLFSITPNVMKKGTVAILCSVVLILLAVVGCNKLKNTENLQYIKTELGGCNLRSEQKSSDTETKSDTVIITISGDSVHIFVGLNFACKELPFETRYEIIDDVIVIHIVDSGGEYYRCICYYTFDFVFKYQGEINQKYKILLHKNLRGDGEEPISIFSEGIITNNIKH